jgi:hypothetical protein
MLCDDSQGLPECPTSAAQLLMVILFDVKFERGMLISSYKWGPWLHRMLPAIGASHISVLEALGVTTDGGLMVRRRVRGVSKLATGVTSD